jgi:hypothetical protein
MDIKFSDDTRSCTITTAEGVVTITMDGDIPTIRQGSHVVGTLSLDPGVTVTVIPVVYRDAANWKLHEQYVLRGAITPEQEARLRATLNEDAGLHHFIPTQIGETHLGPFNDRWTEDDHVWHELGVDDIETSDRYDVRVPLMTVEEFVTAMEDAAAAGWDGSVSVEDL